MLSIAENLYYNLFSLCISHENKCIVLSVCCLAHLLRHAWFAGCPPRWNVTHLIACGRLFKGGLELTQLWTTVPCSALYVFSAWSPQLNFDHYFKFKIIVELKLEFVLVSTCKSCVNCVRVFFVVYINRDSMYVYSPYKICIHKPKASGGMSLCSTHANAVNNLSLILIIFFNNLIDTNDILSEKII
jgi:hypothetical protein